MSLIQEALKRQQEEMQNSVGTPPPIQEPVQAKGPHQKIVRRNAPAAATPPPAPQSAPPVQMPPPIQEPLAMAAATTQEPPAEEPPPIPPEAIQPPPVTVSPKKPLLIIAASIIIVFGILGAGGWFAFQWLVEKTEITPSSTPTVEQPAPTPEPVAVPVVAMPITSDPPSNTTPETHPQVNMPLATPEVVAPPPPPVKQPVVWPVLSCTGVAGRGKKGSAFLNGQIVSVNETIEDVKVISIGERSVTLEYRGERKVLKVDGTIQ